MTAAKRVRFELPADNAPNSDDQAKVILYCTNGKLKLAAQYDSYHPFPDLTLHGKQTLAENIADLGGIAASYDAYVGTLNGNPAQEQDGFSGTQQFFIAYGQAHKNKAREAALRRQVMIDEHSPSEYRTDTVRNIDDWYKDFQVQLGETLYLATEERVRIW